ncbi:glycogen/starch/alpha-glucan phosphorylase [Bradyrhizobium sp. LHD-71]|uniref:glycogen/starch/alpha-glucan phosphorylase n=1 Tax=Bradyrhizobium sp. LHD-71 TaxID=3072141 RepID=UPI00280F28CD|nr:glycogen/starch/alpha-glucan phosphorylase [Bradyrhizobium sp. LHD-71]MDQ8727699.1 glycogen/starch/alpha-glucan phosphorylase [Bradyrhizobium sp. LHD-71]
MKQFPFRSRATPDPVHDDIAEIRGAMLSKIALMVGKEPERATKHDWYVAAALTLRDRIVHRWLESERETRRAGKKRVYYLSLEFLIGRLFCDALGNMELMSKFAAALRDFGINLRDVAEVEPDAALGNGGLGRLAACFMDSMASLAIPAQGYGIRYEHGLFRQLISNGWQEEFPEQWLASGNPWEFERSDVVYNVHYGGHIRRTDRRDGSQKIEWVPDETIKAVAFDTPIVGWRERHVNALRLWSARAVDPMQLETFNRGDHLGAMSEMARAEAISKFLYPSDEQPAGKELRLRQEYFFVSASLQDIIEAHLRSEGSVRTLATRAAIQLNDTHPSLAVPELIRLLVDKYALSWREAREITQQTISYTNHTLLPEALESWPVELFERMLPRHLEIIYRINVENLAAAEAHAPSDARYIASVSLIDEAGGRRVRMGHLAFVGSHRINGVSEMHSELMKETVFADLNALYPGRITNKTNGITFRRWLHGCNPGLTELLKDVCGDVVLDDPLAARRLEVCSEDHAVMERFMQVKRRNKAALSSLIASSLGTKIDPTSLFDIQIKRIHEYKRQLLNALETIGLYLAIRDEPNRNWTPRVKIFAGKAAASYQQAKLIIKLINDVASVVNNDPSIRNLLKVVFLPNYNVSAAEVLVPACDLSEQISTAGMEASGTGNMKLALNGARTIGTLDGANIEIRDHVGEENIFIFGMKADEVLRRRKLGLDATESIERSAMLGRVIDALDRGDFSPDDPSRFAPITHSLRYLDYYMVSVDFDDYYRTQRKIDSQWATPGWASSSMLNVARMGWFSSDRTVREYAEDIWGLPALNFEAPS